ncbi:MAG: hypothetical protein LBC12_02565 [Nitrososphaerota archaeon]|jgi:hypothetical protein|nr:hypothetical protein [Nitrososphaerota archaeon]
MSTQPQQTPETKRSVCETNSVNLSALINQHIASLPNPEGWHVLAIDPLNDMIVLIRDVKNK